MDGFKTIPEAGGADYSITPLPPLGFNVAVD